MKTALLVLTISILSCTKEEIIVEKPKAISGTFWLHQYDANNTYLGTILSYHACKIEDPSIIEQWESYLKLSPICDTNDILELKLSVPCKDVCEVINEFH